ncbi:MAG: ribosome maturation factor RimM [Clostridia bacterium]
MLLVAKSIKPHGIKGELKVEYYLDDLSSFLRLQTVTIENTCYKIESIRGFQKPPYALLKLESIDDMDSAELIRGKSIFTNRENMPIPKKGHYYIDDIVGCQVVLDGKILGLLKNVMQNGSADVFDVIGKSGEVLFPYIGDVVSSIDIDHKLITLNKDEFDKVAVYED